MNKSDLIEALADKESLREKQATDIINLILKGFMETLKKGERIDIRGFGSFTVRQHEAHIGKNPRTGKDVDVRPKKRPFFKVGKDMKGLVDKGK